MGSGDFDYAIQLLQTCCKIDPANYSFRQLLRRAQKEKYGNNLHGSLAALEVLRLTQGVFRFRAEDNSRRSQNVEQETATLLGEAARLENEEDEDKDDTPPETPPETLPPKTPPPA